MPLKPAKCEPMRVLPVRGISKPHGRWCRRAGTAVVAGIDPESAGVGLAISREKHWHRRIVRMNLAGVQCYSTSGMIHRLTVQRRVIGALLCTSCRSRCSGNGWGADFWCGIIAVGGFCSASRLSRRVSSCAILRSSFLGWRPNCMRLNLAICSFSCSMSSVRTLKASASDETVLPNCSSSSSRSNNNAFRDRYRPPVEEWLACAAVDAHTVPSTTAKGVARRNDRAHAAWQTGTVHRWWPTTP